MQEKFHKSKKLSKTKLHALMQRSDHPALRRYIIQWVLFILMSVLVVLSWGGPIWQVIVSQLGFGILCCSMFASLHEAGHGTAFQSKRLNKIAGTLSGMAHLYPLSIFKELHFTHHRHTHIPGLDPEISIGDQAAPAILTNPPIYLGFLTGLPLLAFKITFMFIGILGTPEFIRKRLMNYVRPKKRRQIAIDSALTLMVQLGIILLAINVHAGFWGLIVGQVVGHCLLSSHLVMEHNGLPHEGDILEKTRSIRTNKFVNLVMWNMPYHAEHHAYPAVPFHALPLLHEEIKTELKHKEEGHPDFHMKTLRNFIINKK